MLKSSKCCQINEIKVLVLIRKFTNGFYLGVIKSLLSAIKMVYNGDVESDEESASSKSNSQNQDESESEEEFLARGTKRKSIRNERQTRRSKRNKYDEDDSNHGSSRRSNRRQPDDFEKQSKTLCAKLNLKNIKIEYSEEDLKTLTTFKRYEDAIEPLIKRKNPDASDDSLHQLLDLKWRQFQRTNCADYQENGIEPAEEPAKKKRTNYKEVGSSDENLETDYEEDYVQEMKKQSKQKAKQKKQANHDYCEECRNAGELIMCDACPRSYHHVCLEPELEETPEGKWLCPKCEAGEEPEEASDHDEYCEHCQDGGELLCCDTCPAAYHIYCLNPPLATIPDGVWKCPECLTAPLPYKVQQILSWRWITLDQQPSTSSSKALPNSREFFVKYEDKSYWDCAWVTQMQLKLFQPGRYRAYVSKTDMDEVPEFELEDESRYPRLKTHNGVDLVKKYYQFGVKSDWLLVHRIISQKADGSKPKEYLVKWRDQAYDQSTWEKADADIPGLKEAIKLFKEGEKQKYPSKPLSSLKDKYEGQPGFLKGMGLQLHPYQIEGLNWLRHSWNKNLNTILADEMGLGKTIQTITFLYSLYVEGHCKGPFLIAVPLSTLVNWEREFELWAPNFYCLSYVGERTSRKMIQQCELYVGRKQTRKFQVLLTTYEFISMDSHVLNRYNWEVLVVDEAQRLKSNVTRFYQKLSEYKIAYRLLLTGTPLQNNLEELYHLLHFINDKKFYDIDRFTEEFADLSKENQVKRLHALLGPHMLRRLKADVLDMPSKSEFFIRIELSPMQKQYYKYILTKNFEALNPKGPGHKTSLINIMMDLKKCCNHPYLFTAAAEKAPIGPKGLYDTQTLIKASGKFVLLDKMLKKLRERGHRVLIFSQMTRLLDLLEEYLEGEDYQYERIDGSTNGVLRQEAIDRFNAPGAKQFVFLLSTRAGGLGINLATADTVIIYDSDWNPHNDTQAFSRCHRIGQKNKVMIYRFVARGSVEEQIARVAKRKMMLTHLVVRPGMGGSFKLSKDELDNIIKFGTEELFKEEGESEEIVYDDKAVEQLLDRSNEGIEEQKDNLANDYLSSFKVADYVTKGDSDAEDDESKQAKSDYWFKLLGEYRENEMVKKFGKGKRLRKKIDYTLSKDDNRNKPVLDNSYEYHSESSDTSQDGDFDIDTFNNPKTKQRKQPLPPLLQLTETNFEVYGFNARQRKAYLSSIMRFGAPPPNTYISQWLTRDLQNKPESVFNAYTTLFMKHLCEKESDRTDTFSDGVPKEGLSRQLVLTRIGVMSLIRRKVREYEQFNGYYSMPRKEKTKKAQTPKKINSTSTIDLTGDESRHSECASTIDLTNTEDTELKPNEDIVKVEANTTANPSTIDLTSTEDPELKEPENPSITDPSEAKQAEKTTTPEPKQDENTTTVPSDPKQPLETPTQDASEPKSLENSTTVFSDPKQPLETPTQDSSEPKPLENSTTVPSDPKQPLETPTQDASEPKPLENATTEPSESTSTLESQEITPQPINLPKPTKKKRKPKRIGYKKRARNPFHIKNAAKNVDALETSINTTTNTSEISKIIVEAPDNDLKANITQNPVIKEEVTSTTNATELVDATNASIKPESLIEQAEKVVTTSDASKEQDQSGEKSSALRKLLQDAEIDEDTPLARRKSKKYCGKTDKDQFQFNIQDGGFTELHTIWLNEERSIALFPSQKYEMWNRRHDYWLLAGITVHGYCDRKSDKNDCQYDYITKDPRFAVINEPFLKGQGINITQQVKHQFLFRRQKLLEQALVIEEQLRRAANVNILKNPDDPVTSLNAKIAHAKSIAEVQLKNSPSRISREVFHQMIEKLDALLTEVKEDSVRLPAGVARGLPVAKQLENSERSILSRFNTETRSAVQDLAKFPRGFTECLSSYTNGAVNFADFQAQYKTPAECDAASAQSTQEVIDLSDDDASAA